MIRRGNHSVVGFGDAQCPDNPPPPAGYVVWRGPVPVSLTQWALALVGRVAGPPFGQQWTKSYGSQTVVARKDHHTWTFRKHPDGSTALVTGICIPGITLYRPAPDRAVLGGVPDVTDPATAAPDPEFALYAGLHPAPRTNWGLVAAGAAAGATALGVLLLGLRAAGARW